MTKVYIYEGGFSQYRIDKDSHYIAEEFLTEIPQELLDRYLELQEQNKLMQKELRKYKNKELYGTED